MTNYLDKLDELNKSKDPSKIFEVFKLAFAMLDTIEEQNDELAKVKTEIESLKTFPEKTSLLSRLYGTKKAAEEMRLERNAVIESLIEYADPDNWEGGQFKPCSPYNYLAKVTLQEIGHDED